MCLKWSYVPNFPGGSAGKESACNVGGLDLIPALGRTPGEGSENSGCVCSTKTKEFMFLLYIPQEFLELARIHVIILKEKSSRR